MAFLNKLRWISFSLYRVKAYYVILIIIVTLYCTSLDGVTLYELYGIRSDFSEYLTKA